MTYQEFLDTYDNEKLDKLANEDLIYPKGFEYYYELKNEVLSDANIPHPKDDKDTNDYPCDYLDHEELHGDCCEIINHLAQLIIDERDKRDKFIEELKRTLKYTIEALDKDFDDY